MGGIASKLKFPLAAFATNGIIADLLYGILRKAIELVELNAELKVMFITCDGASPNRRFFEMHKSEVQGDVENSYALDEVRYTYFISYVPHLLKTTRNCFCKFVFNEKEPKALEMWKVNLLDAGGGSLQEPFTRCPV